MPASSPSVLIIRLDAIGDALALTPLLAALRERSIPVDIVLRDVNANVFSSRAARRIYDAPFALRSDAVENLEEIRAFGAALRGNRYTHVLVATEDPGGYRLARAVGAAERIGFVNGWGKPLKTIWARSMLTRAVYRSAGLDPKAPHEVEVLFKLGRSLLEKDALPTHDLSLLRPLVLEREPEPNDRLAFQVTDKWQRLGIPMDDVVACFEGLRERADISAFASAKEGEYAAEFARRTGVFVDSFDDTERWKEAIASAQTLVAPDSGALHVAGMIGTPTVAVFQPGRDFALQSARWSPWSAASTIIEATSEWPTRAAEAAYLHAPMRR